MVEGRGFAVGGNMGWGGNAAWGSEAAAEETGGGYTPEAVGAVAAAWPCTLDYSKMRSFPSSHVKWEENHHLEMK